LVAESFCPTSQNGRRSRTGLVRSPVEERSLNFYRWERRGRGWRSFPYPVPLEPAFVPFRYLAETRPPVDDGRHHTWLSKFLERLSGKQAKPATPAPEVREPESEPYEAGERSDLVLRPPRDLASTPALAEAWLRTLSVLRAPASFELVGLAGRVHVVLSAERRELPLLSSQLRAFFPALGVEEGEDALVDAWRDGLFSVVEFGLAREFMLPLQAAKSFSPDPLTGLAAALSQARDGEVALLQVLFQEAKAPWQASTLRSVATPSGASFFEDAPDITRFAREKVSGPLFAVAVRAAVAAGTEERLWTLLRGIGGALAGATRGENELVPLGGEDPTELLCDVVFRTSHRSGMLLSLSELLSLIHLPASSVEGIVRETARTKALPAEARDEGILLGYNRDHGEEREVRLPTEARMRHVHVVGASGTGKSTLLVSMILEDIAAGHGVGVIDPHGDLVDELLGRIPEARVDDVILFDPADPEYAVGWNILSAYSEPEREMLASDLVAAFRRLATSWGDQMTAVLANAILAFLDSDEGGTLSDLRRFLGDPSFRKSFLPSVRDPYIRDFWTLEFPLVSGKPQGSILTRLDSLLRSRLVRGVLTARDKPLDFRRVVDDGRIFLARLSQGAIGEENAALLGSLLVSKIHQVSLLRQGQAEADRRPFFLYLDEFHHVATPSMASLFTGVRKYRLAVTVAHQNLSQLRTVPEVEEAVLAEAYTRIVFRVGDKDAKTLGQSLAFFTADDLGNLGTGEAIVRLGRKEQDFNLKTVPVEHGDALALAARRCEMRLRSLLRWGTPRTEEAPRPVPAPEAEPQRTALPRVEKPAVPPGVEPVPRPETKAPPVAEAPESRRLGKGGAEHTYLQELVKRWAEERGFRAAVEEQIPGGRESIDVALYRGETRIACEISVTTPLEYEVGNVEKCLAAGFKEVAVISLKKARLAKLDKLLAGALPSEHLKKVHLLTPEELLSWLDGQPVEEKAGTVGGYKVKVRYTAPQAVKSRRVAEILARSTRRLPKDEA
jgi:DNA helicase HerA-like ATPase